MTEPPPPPPGAESPLPPAPGPAWPQPPPPPAAAAWGSGATPSWPAPARADGRAAFLALAIGAAIASWLLFLLAAVFAARVAALPSAMAGTAELDRDSSVLVTLAVILAAATIAAVWAGRQWLGNVRRATDAASIGALLGPVDPAPPEWRSMPACRGIALALLVLATVGIAAVVAGLALWISAGDPTLTRGGLGLVLAGAAACVVAQGLLPAFLRAIERRECRAALPDALGWRPALPAARHPIGGLVASLVGLSCIVLGALAVGPIRLQDVACAAPDGWQCATVDVAAVPGDTASHPDLVSVAYAVRRATGVHADGRRVLVIAVGGPGSSGIAEADWYESSLPQRILDAYDLVLFDARGVGSTDRRECPSAFEAYARSENPAAAHAFADACIREAGATDLDMRRFGTDAVVTDLESIREALGAETVAVYGASYGTVVAQAYAAAHPDRVSALVLDAPVDRHLDGLAVWQAASDGFGEVLDETFRACRDDAGCARALGDPGGAWSRLVTRVDRAGGIGATMPDRRGRPTRHDVTATNLYGAVRSALYEPTGRMLFLRALAAADGGDDRLLVRLAESSGDPTYWPGAFSYYATWCADSRVSPTARADDLAAFEAAIRAHPTDGPDADEVVRTLMPCLYWPTQPALGVRPPDPSGVPTLILTATSDPITPDTEARRLLDAIDGARLVEVSGGGHVSLGSGYDCVDDPVADLLVTGREPAARVTTCDGWVADTFVDLTPYGRRPIDAPWSVAVELLNDPEYVFWPGDRGLVVPCLWTGSARITNGDRADEVVLDGCSMSSGTPPIDGRGTIDWYSGTADLRVTMSAGELTFRLGSDGPHATGTWNGRPYTYGN